MSKKGKKRKGILYSTNPDFEYEYEDNKLERLPNEQQKLEIWIDKKNRAGKVCVLIKKFIGSEEDLKSLGRKIKNKCGTGGSVKKGEIIIQGDIRNKVIEILKKEGYSTKSVGG